MKQYITLILIISLSFHILCPSVIAEAQFSNEPRNFFPSEWISVTNENGDLIGIRELMVVFYNETAPSRIIIEINKTSKNGIRLWEGAYNTKYSESFYWEYLFSTEDDGIIIIGKGFPGNLSVRKRLSNGSGK